MKVGLVGAGLQGKRRARALMGDGRNSLVVIADVDEEATNLLALEAGCSATTRWEVVVQRRDVEAVLVCTPPHLHAPISIAAMRKGKHVLCEKPLARSVAEAQEMVRTAQECSVILKCGLNHRHHPSLQKARAWLEQGLIGEMDFVRCRYGIGGRPGYEKEWRAQPEISGGGQLMDQGIHALDLFRWFLGDFAEVTGVLATRFWPISPLEDNVFALLRTARGQVASLHASWTQWKPLFSLELFGHDDYVIVEGLGGAYGSERAALGRRAFGEPFREEVVEFRGEDRYWQDEWAEFIAAIQEDREPLGNGKDGLEAVRLAFAVYESARRGCAVRLGREGAATS